MWTVFVNFAHWRGSTLAIYKTVLIIFPLNLQTITITLDVVKWRWGGFSSGWTAKKMKASVSHCFVYDGHKINGAHSNGGSVCVRACNENPNRLGPWFCPGSLYQPVSTSNVYVTNRQMHTNTWHMHLYWQLMKLTHLSQLLQWPLARLTTARSTVSQKFISSKQNANKLLSLHKSHLHLITICIQQTLHWCRCPITY